MSVALMKILWTSTLDGITRTITDSISFTSGKGLDIKNNVLVLTLKNSATRLDSNQNLLHKYVDAQFEVRFREDDQIKVYLKHTDDMADVEDTSWSQTNTTEPDSDNLLGIFYVVDVNTRHEDKDATVQIKCADKTYVLFNRLLAKTFPLSDALSAPEIIQKVVRFSSQNVGGEYLGDGDDAGVRYDIDAVLESDGGFIQDTRRATTESGNVNSDTTFPDVTIAKVWKPVYEWISELSQIEYLNTENELSGSSGKEIVYGRSFLYYVDENNKFHWEETDDTTDTDLDIGEDTVYSFKLVKSIFDSVNFIVYRGGEDFYGNGTLDYVYDENTNVSRLKMKVIAMTDIAKKLIQDEISNGNLIENTSGTFTFSGNRYNRSGTVTPSWTSTSYANDSSYNSSLRTEIFKRCDSRARALLTGIGSARYKGDIERKGILITPGTLYKLTNSYTGQKDEVIRSVEIKHNVTKTGWFTTETLQQDEQAITGEVN